MLLHSHAFLRAFLGIFTVFDAFSYFFFCRRRCLVVKHNTLPTTHQDMCVQAFKSTGPQTQYAAPMKHLQLFKNPPAPRSTDVKGHHRDECDFYCHVSQCDGRHRRNHTSVYEGLSRLWGLAYYSHPHLTK